MVKAVAALLCKRAVLCTITQQHMPRDYQRPCPVCTMRLQGVRSYCHSCVTHILQITTLVFRAPLPKHYSNMGTGIWISVILPENT